MKVNQLKAGAFLSYIALILNVVISLFYTPYMLKTLGKSEYGLFSLVNSVITYLTILDFGFGNAIIRYTAKFRAAKNLQKEQSMNGMFLILYSGIGVLAFLLGLWLVLNVESLFGKALNNAELGTAKVLMWLAVINIALTFPFSIFASIIQAYERFVFFQTVRIIRMTLTPLLMVAVLALGYRSIGIVSVTTMLNVLFNLISLCYCFKNLKIRFRFGGYDFLLLKEITVYSFYIFLNMVVDRVYWSTGQFLLGVLAGTAAISIFTIGMQINMYYMQLSTAASSVFLPRITAISMQDNNTGQLSKLFIRVGRIQFLVIAAFLGGFMILGKRFITMWAGPDYALSFKIALWLLIPITVPLIQNLGITILQAKNLQAFRAVVYLGIAVFNLIISIPLIKAAGALGSAWGIALSLIIGQIIIMNLYYYKRLKLDIPAFWGEIGKMLPAALVPIVVEAGLVRCLPVAGLGVFLFHGLVYIVMYGLGMWFWGLNQYEKELIAAPLRRIARRV
jgi:O-antigen/teichoic acid export membrane protein